MLMLWRMQHYVVPHNRREKEAPARKEDDKHDEIKPAAPAPNSLD